MEDLLHCTFHPLRNIARLTMPEEKFHAQFGKDFCTELIKTADGKAKVQEALNQYFPYLPSFFGADKSKNNEMYRKYGLKQRSNEEMRIDYIERVGALVQSLGLTLPEVRLAA